MAWTLAYDTEYAMVDRDDDIKIGVKSTAILLGNLDRVFIGACHLVLFGALALAGVRVGLGVYYYAGLILAAGFAARQHYLIRDRDPSSCFMAFLNNNCLGMAVFVGLAADYLF